jgi:hypothetical protein
MSDPTPAAAPPEAEKPNFLRKVLFAVLAVMIVALIYEYGIVRRSYKAAEAAVDDFVDQRTSEAITPQAVQARLGKAPNGGLQDKGDYYVEHYKWVRWLPWKSYDIYVVYEHTDPPRLFNTTRPDPPTANEVPVVGLAYDPASAPPGDGDPSSSEGSSDAAPQRQRPTAEDEGASAGDTAEPSGEALSQPEPSEATTPAAERATDAEPAAPSEAPAPSDAETPAAPTDASEDDNRKAEEESE